MTNDVLDGLRRHDPAADLDATAPAELLDRLVAEPRTAPPAPRRRLVSRRPVRILVGFAAAAALLAGVSTGLDRGGSPDLAARAYAQTEAVNEILHVVLRGGTDFPEGAPPDTSTTTESWVYGDEAHTVLMEFDAAGKKTFTSDQLLGTDGVIHNHLSDTGETQTVKPSDGAEAREIIAHSRRDFVADFRARYERGVLDDDGAATFEGRPARRYVVDWPATRVGGRPGPAQREEYYLDAATGAPLGWTAEMPLYAPKLDDGNLRQGKLVGHMRNTVVVERIERLAATPANLAHVRAR